MKKLIQIFALLIFSISYSQKPIGIGIVSINFDDDTKIDFYKSSDFKIKEKTIEFFEDPIIDSWNIKNLNDHRKWLKPESLWLDYHQFLFRCKTKNNDGYEVYVSDDKTMWIKQKEIIDYLNWEEYLKNMFSVNRLDTKNQKIYFEPSETSEIIEGNSECFKVTKMRGDWLKVETAKHCKKEETISGWLKWKNDNEILISYFPTS